MANKSRHPKHARELIAVCKRQCFASCQGAQDDYFPLNKIFDFILSLHRFNTVMQSLRGALIALFYSSTFLSAMSTVGLVLLGGQLKSTKEK